MRIVVLLELEGDVIAYEDPSDGGIGEFAAGEGGAVVYRDPAIETPFWAAADLEAFRKIVGVWNRYSNEVRMHAREEDQENVLAWMRESLQKLGVLGKTPQSVWDIYVARAEQTMI